MTQKAWSAKREPVCAHIKDSPLADGKRATSAQETGAWSLNKEWVQLKAVLAP